jgi:hypothetical protein
MRMLGDALREFVSFSHSRVAVQRATNVIFATCRQGRNWMSVMNGAALLELKASCSRDE